MAAGAKDNAAVEAGDGCVLGDRGKICFGFENGDGKGSVRLKVEKWWGGPAGLGAEEKKGAIGMEGAIRNAAREVQSSDMPGFRVTSDPIPRAAVCTIYP
ncbi:hypothetical protein NC653_028557 [Populus alba x Populus x berolinensis]|uniref:Uncharacterized protein n=1 Tax=Populus alba x Populus x berolinensis TaxID=444605 RepID=A0AAD6Q2F5_9ROSI|nr:hypothetical protein NC653_028557 [Populus alba x Populus x berolinensis]